ncbi:Arginyl-tRNA synthetase [hydrothermal vent metagenome]|uniref:arginine--tRNA ligase n=1 Tax=hydrothermal vent metagenome TaxID=652676 RepID=A0A3B1CF31_9ZZZZ
MKQTILREIEKAYAAAFPRQEWEGQTTGVEILIPKDEKFGDFSTNAAMILASKLKSNPRAIAEKIKTELEKSESFSSVAVAGPGFINMTIKPSMWIEKLGGILEQKDKFGKSDAGKGVKALVEFVSANPTGPLHIGHGRGAAVGDCLARILKMAGYDVSTEYYINDVGLQMENLGRSTLNRVKEIMGRAFDEPAYKGEYIKDIARSLIEAEGEDILDLPEDEALKKARKFTERMMIETIKKDLDDFRVSFDNWFSEETLHKNGDVTNTIERLIKEGHIYEKDGALWLKTESAGDEKDRVVKRADGRVTYLAADIAYHKNKLKRGFDLLIDIWGADHHGYIPRMKAMIAALGANPDRLVPRLVQMVNLKRGGKVVAMTTRGGVFTTLREIVDEVGVDATRYFFLMRSADSHLDFDVDLAKTEGDENPVYYIQYAHARCCNIFVNARTKEIKPLSFNDIDKSLLEQKDELRLIRKLLEFPDIIKSCALSYQPHPVAQYLSEVAAMFHYFYSHNRVVTDDIGLTQARLLLVESSMTVLKNGLTVLGVTAPKRM